jgi:alpha-amylase
MVVQLVELSVKAGAMQQHPHNRSSRTSPASVSAPANVRPARRTAYFSRRGAALVLWGFAAAAVAPSAAFQAGCVSIPDAAKKPALVNRVTDWRDEVVYQVLVDRFADGDLNNDYAVKPDALARHQGGDWRGLEEHLSYLQDLGVTTVWISPVVRNVDTDADVDAYHGYWAQDLSATNPHFGDLAALRSLSASIHDRGMKILLDVVTNHMGQVFFYDMNLNGKPDIYIGGTGSTSPVTRTSEFDPDFDPRGIQAFTSLGIAGPAPRIFIDDPSINRVRPGPGILGMPEAYHGLGRILSYDDPDQVLRGDFPGGLKDLATENEAVRAQLIDSFASWVEQVDFDGFRIDTVKHVEHDFWKEFTARVRERIVPQGKTNFIMFGEAFDGNDQLLGSYTVPGELDSVFYFSQHFQVYQDVFQSAHDPTAQKGTKQIEDLWTARATNYGATPQDNGIGVPPFKALVNFLDNHDQPRFLYGTDTGNGPDVAALRNALTLLMTEEGIPCVYYGTEQDFNGGNDPANREVLWETGFPESGATFQHFANLAQIRRASVALRRGDTLVRYSTTNVGAESDAGIFAFERSGGDAADSYVLVVMNTNDFKTSSTMGDGGPMKTTLPAGTALFDLLDPATHPDPFIVGAEGSLVLTIAPQSALILAPQDQATTLRAIRRQR